MRVSSAKARYAALRRHRDPDDPVVVEAEGDLDVAVAEQDLRRSIEALIPGAPEIPDSVIAILRAARRHSIPDGGAAA